MATRLSRRKIASYYADELLAGKREVATQLAAYLLDTRRTRELQLIVRDVEDALAARGILVADIATARELSKDAKVAITDFLKQYSDVKSVQVRETIDPDLLGGVRINTPSDELDATLRRKLTQLKATKI